MQRTEFSYRYLSKLKATFGKVDSQELNSMIIKHDFPIEFVFASGRDSIKALMREIESLVTENFELENRVELALMVFFFKLQTIRILFNIIVFSTRISCTNVKMQNEILVEGINSVVT